MTSLVAKVKGRLVSGYLDLTDNLPGKTRDFSWKVRWRMRNDRNPLFVVVQDKYRVKEFARERGVCSAELYHVTDDPRTIPFDSLPDEYFIKANHGCQWNIYCKDRRFYYYKDGYDLIGRGKRAKYTISRDQVIKYCNAWLGCIYSRREWAYSCIPPRIIVEEALEQRGGGELVNYRCFTFNGVVRAIQVDTATSNVRNQVIFVDPGWREIPLKNLAETVAHILPERPATFAEIVAMAERLGCDFDFMRVDIYDTTCGVLVGEMTVNPMGGVPMEPTPDRDFNQWLGDQWVLPEAKRLSNSMLVGSR